MTRMTGPDCVVMCNLINTYIHTYIHTYIALIKELAIRRVQHRSETYSNQSQHLAEGTEVARLWRRFFFFTAATLIPHASPSLQTGGGACEHPTAPFARPGVGTSASYREGNLIRGAGKSERGRGRDLSRGWERRR